MESEERERERERGRAAAVARTAVVAAPRQAGVLVARGVDRQPVVDVGLRPVAVVVPRAAPHRAVRIRAGAEKVGRALRAAVPVVPRRGDEVVLRGACSGRRSFVRRRLGGVPSVPEPAAGLLALFRGAGPRALSSRARFGHREEHWRGSAILGWGLRHSLELPSAGSALFYTVLSAFLPAQQCQVPLLAAAVQKSFC